MSTSDDRQCGSSGEITSNIKECTSCEQNNIDNITEGIDGVAILDDTSICAACGKRDNNEMNICNRCKMVKYCNAACKKKHRSKHKKKCDRRVAELYDEQLFKEVEAEECPICFLPLSGQRAFQTCCGKVICSGCMYAMKMSEGKDLCAFCRTPPALSTNKEDLKRLKILMDKGNGKAFHYLAELYRCGRRGLPRDWSKSIELCLKAGELGCADGYCSLGFVYMHGQEVERDIKKAQYYFELATMGGNITARHNLACIEGDNGNEHRAMKHFMIAARAGSEESLNGIKKNYIRGIMKGLITKDEYANTLRAYQKRQEEVKSDERDKAVIYYASIGATLQYGDR